MWQSGGWNHAQHFMPWFFTRGCKQTQKPPRGLYSMKRPIIDLSVMRIISFLAKLKSWYICHRTAALVYINLHHCEYFTNCHVLCKHRLNAVYIFPQYIYNLVVHYYHPYNKNQGFFPHLKEIIWLKTKHSILTILFFNIGDQTQKAEHAK